jgi:spoIIIJ-associated protein
VEWVVTTGKTVEQAKERALDQLGIAADEAEFETITSPKKGLFGMVRGEAQIRARVRPVQPRAKKEARRGRDGGGNKRSGGNKRGGGQGRAKSGGAGGRQGGSNKKTDSRAEGDEPRETVPAKKKTSGRKDAPARNKPKKDQEAIVNMSVQEQSEVVEEFLGGLVEAFGFSADVSTTEIEEDTVLVRVDGDGLGLMVGRKGRTLSAIHEISRAVLHREADGPLRGRIRLDVAGYRERRQIALEGFVREAAAKVIEDGVDLALEPMSAPDRKIVHDTAAEIEGIRTLSEGEEPNRRVVLVVEGDG